jgi:hypothetical protein
MANTTNRALIPVDDVIEAEIVPEVQQGGVDATPLTDNEIEDLFNEEQEHPQQPRGNRPAQDPGEITLSKQRTWGRTPPPRPDANRAADPNPQQGGVEAEPLSDDEIEGLFNEEQERPQQPRSDRPARDPGEITLSKQRTWGC